MQNTASVLIGPVTTTLNLRSDPPGAQLALDTGDVTTPADHAVIAGSAHQLIAPEIQGFTVASAPGLTASRRVSAALQSAPRR